ncbi:MAG TPA: hypothetical protein DC054_07555 [Blastocatellia bacterium]|nr:hypothetical protein [Blastocatellia bacterium]
MQRQPATYVRARLQMKTYRSVSRLEPSVGRLRRAPASISKMALALVMLIGAVLGCGSSNPGLDRILDARDKHAASEALRDHGSVKAEEVQYIYEATSSSSENRRRNAAHLLITTVKGNAVELQHKALLETRDVVVWAILLDDLLEKEPELAGKRPEMIKAALDQKDSDTLAVGLRAGALSNYPGVRELARKYLDHADGKVRAAAVSGLLPDDVRELLPRLTDMIGKEQDEDTFILLAKSLIRTNDPNATEVVIKAIEHLKETRDTLYLHFFNDLALFTPPDPVITKFMFTLVRGKSTIRDEGFSVFSRWVWSVKRDPDPAFVRICIEEINQGNLSTDPRRRPEAKSEQNACEEMLSFMNDGKNPIGDFEGRVRGKDAVAFAEKWLKEHGG